MATKKSYKFKIGQHVKYIGEDQIYKGIEFVIESREVYQQFLRKEVNLYKLTEKGNPSNDLFAVEKLLKLFVVNPVGKKFIKSIDQRAKAIQKASGVKRTEKVVFYNLSRSEAKEKAFKETKK